MCPPNWKKSKQEQNFVPDDNISLMDLLSNSVSAIDVSMTLYTFAKHLSYIQCWLILQILASFVN